MQGYGWILVGVLAGTITALTRVDQVALSWLSAFVPLPWDRIVLGGLVVVACSSAYFRSHWIATLRELRSLVDRTVHERERADRIAEDTERIALLITDNLHEVTSDGGSEAVGELYLDGARAHATKLLEVRDRMRALALRLDPRTLRPSDAPVDGSRGGEDAPGAGAPDA